MDHLFPEGQPPHHIVTITENDSKADSESVRLKVPEDTLANLDHVKSNLNRMKHWMNEWTVFYWSWWIAWSPFVGAFIAKISRGRTIREFIHGSLTAPVLYSFLWLTVFGGSGIKMERNAAMEGLCCPNWKENLTTSTELQYVPADKSEWGEILCVGEACNPCSKGIIVSFEEDFNNLTHKINSSLHFGSTSMVKDSQITRLSCHEKEKMWFFLMASYGTYGYFLSVVSLVGLVLYLLTSSDSGSLIIDTLASNGDNEPPVTQRVFWALVEGGCATSLLAAGGRSALLAIQTASIVAAFPYTILLLILCVSIYQGLVQDFRDDSYDPPSYTIGLLDFVTTWQPRLLRETAINVFLGPYNCGKCLARINRSNHAFIWQMTLSLLLIGVVVFYAIEIHLGIPGSNCIAATCYFGYVFYVTGARVLLRMRCRIPGNMIADFIITVFLWPTVIVQMKEHIDAGALNMVVPDEDLRSGSSSIDSRLDKMSADSDLENLAKVYASFGSANSNNHKRQTSATNDSRM